ncbi:MAG: CDP-alcohol phosphatidyltransferase family protein [Planctomycetota bacterium]
MQSNQVSARISHSILDPMIGPRIKAIYPSLRIPSWFPPEGIVLAGHLSAIVGAVGLAYSTTSAWAGILAAVGIAGNHFADCIDGTHARTTGQCRNGGELLDHFTDPLSFAYYLIGIGVACGRMDLALIAVVCLFATAILTNIKAKLIGEFTLSRFGPTEFKCILTMLGASLATGHLFAMDSITLTTCLLFGFQALIAIGLIQLPIQLFKSVREVNRAGTPPDTTEWVCSK